METANDNKNLDMALIEEYLSVTKRFQNQMITSLMLATLVFIVPMILIAINGWWQPFGGDIGVGVRWFVVAAVMMVLAYVVMLIDKVYRK
jgi:hypothetical protein